jgi:hypothetical protein
MEEPKLCSNCKHIINTWIPLEKYVRGYNFFAAISPDSPCYNPKAVKEISLYTGKYIRHTIEEMRICDTLCGKEGKLFEQWPEYIPDEFPQKINEPPKSFWGKLFRKG